MGQGLHEGEKHGFPVGKYNFSIMRCPRCRTLVSTFVAGFPRLARGRRAAPVVLLGPVLVRSLSWLKTAARGCALAPAARACPLSCRPRPKASTLGPWTSATSGRR